MNLSIESRSYIITNLDNPKRILIFTIPELAVIFAPAFLALIFDSILSLILACSGWWFRKLYLRVCSSLPPNILGGIKYWYLPHTGKGKPKLPPSFIREYIS